VKIWSSLNGGFVVDSEGGTHPCTEEDLAKFYKPALGSKKAFDFIKNQNEILCMDKYDKEGKEFPRNIFGETGNDNRTIEIIYIPCIPKQLTPYNKHLVEKECIADLKDPQALKKKL
jgi:hypothetical protein